jgi:hypothetical protein
MRDHRVSTAPGNGAVPGVVHPGAGLRLRLWLGCLLSGVAGGGAVVGLFAWLSPPDPLFDPLALGIWPWSAAALCLALAVGLGLWLDHGIASHLRGLSRAIACGGDPAGLGALPAARGWGELSLLTAQLQGQLARQHEAGRAVAELEELRHRIRGLRGAVEMRLPGQRSEPVRMLEGPLGLLIESLNRRWIEEERVADQSRGDALGLRHELTLALVDARDSAELAERGFVEGTALLTTVRELQRLSGELKQELSAVPETPAAPAVPLAESHQRYRELAAAAIEELVSASNESVGRLATGLVRVQEIGEQVQVLANRATLIALRVALSAPGGSADPGPQREGLSRDLRNLAGEVRAVTDLTAERLSAVDREVEAAVERMKGLRERVAAKLDEAPPMPEAGAAAPRVAQPTEVTLRLLERVREMVQDAATKGERLSAAGERASRAAERLVRRLEEEAGTLEGLTVRLGATEEELREGGAQPGARAPSSARELRPGDLRLLGPDHPGPRATESAPGDDDDAEEGR